MFNKKNQREAESKIHDPRIQVRTLHSLGFMFIKQVWPKAQPDLENEIEADRLNSLGVNFDNNKETFGKILKLIGLVKNLTINPSAQDIQQIVQDYDLGFEQANNQWADDINYTWCVQEVLET